MRSATPKKFDIAIVGAGVLGVTIAYWISQLYDCSVAVIDQAPEVAFHTSRRNTGVIHRPFYLDPARKHIFALTAELSYPLWKVLAAKFGLPWNPVGTLEVATEDKALQTLEKYMAWGLKNGMGEEELELVDRAGVSRLEPQVSCAGAIHSKTDVSVDFGSFTRCVAGLAEASGVRFLTRFEVRSVKTLPDGTHEISAAGAADAPVLTCKLLVNAAGGGSVDIAHMMGLGLGLSDLHFRGDYWIVDEPMASRLTRNIYSVAKRSDFPFLDPHFVVRADGSRQIGPNAALVAGPFTYEGLGRDLPQKLLQRPVSPKLKLFTNGRFFSLVLAEARSSMSKSAMCGRITKFIPALNPGMLSMRGLAGVRSPVIDGNGFVPEAIQLSTGSSVHILNFNSPGATGAPAYSAYVISKMREKGLLEGFTERKKSPAAGWSFQSLAQADW